MYDSVTVSQIPKNAQAVAGYIGGNWVTYAALVKGWPKAHHLSIAIAASEDADALDIEQGDATPDEAPAWVKRQHARGAARPVVYTSLAQAQSLVNRLSAAGIKRNQYRLWTAHYSYHQHLCGPACGLGMKTRADATQWTNRSFGRNLDASFCSPAFFST